LIIVSLKAEKPGTVKLEFPDGASLTASGRYLPDELSSLPEGVCERELSPAEEEAFRFAAACYRAEKKASRLIARAEQFSLGLKAKLMRRGFDTAIASAVVSYFLDSGLVDDGRYAERWIHARLSLKKAPSPRILFVSLRKRGIDTDTAGKALKKTLDPETEYTLLLRYLEKDISLKAEKTGVFRAKIKYEGFSSLTLDRYFDEN
jgi:SOS response regulatory protein OraA/RecX